MSDLLDSLERMDLITNSDVITIASALLNEKVISASELIQIERHITAGEL